MAKKSGRPFWFKIDMSIKPLLDAVPDENAGRAIKAALEYFETRQSVFPNDDPLTLAPLIAMKTAVDDAYSEYEQRIENGKKGGRPRSDEKAQETNTNQEVTNTNHKVTEIEIEKEKDKEYFFREEDSSRSSFFPFFQKSDSVDIRRERLRIVGEGLVTVNDEQLKELYEKISLTDFEHYVEVVRNCLKKGRKYSKQTHAQAIINMAQADGKIITRPQNSSFDTDEFFEAALRKSYRDGVVDIGGTYGNQN